VSVPGVVKRIPWLVVYSLIPLVFGSLDNALAVVSDAISIHVCPLLLMRTGGANVKNSDHGVRAVAHINEVGSQP